MTHAWVHRAWTAAVACLFVAGSAAAGVLGVEPKHGASMYGDLRYGPDFRHFDYVNPNAPRGGTLGLSAIGSFDTLNPFIIRGTPAAGLGLIFESLTTRSADEPFSEYGLIAESIEIPEDRSWVAFNLRPQARWHDGVPITAEDVAFSLETLKTEGAPFYRAYYANVAEVIVEGPHRIRFEFDGTVNRELPLIIGQLPVLPKHYYAEVTFNQTTLTPPLGSGPYRIASVDPGRSIVYERVRDYWGADLPVNVGRHNFDRIRFDYYRESNVALQAFLAGEYDFRVENTARLWAQGYTGPAVDAGNIVLEEFERQGGTGMQGFVFNTRRPIFRDPRVREALGYAFDWEWSNRTLFFDQYTRSRSYFSNSYLAAEGLPSEAELELLEPFRESLDPRVFTTEYDPPMGDPQGNIRGQLRTALNILEEAGWTVQGGVLTETATGRRMEFEILLDNPAFERVVGPFISNLERLGVRARQRTVDPSQYRNRLDAFDFDMTVTVWGQSLSPGNEQRDFWSCAARDTPGSRNLAGVCNEAVESLVSRIIQAPSREALVDATHALDRTLQWGFYVVPHWHTTTQRVARWNIFGIPDELPIYGIDLWAWWIEPAMVEAVGTRRRARD
ncbi:MAG: ABC transporter substrate-binding protein [Geminicoccaceae bacterium]|nr:MAG: ABC transporter substrate-binding protein [Geminicoccaceae bacterium]